MQRRGFCLSRKGCSRKKGRTIVVEGKEFPRCYLHDLVDCRYLIIINTLTQKERELIRLFF